MSIGPSDPLFARGDYAWEIATRFPEQGQWSENDYFALIDSANTKGLELVNGQIEVLPVPTRIHQLLSKFFFLALNAFVDAGKRGEVHYSGLRFRIRERQIREPDVIFLSAERMDLAQNKAFNGADLCMEVVSGDADDRRRDYVDKVRDYAERGVREYWIVDPDDRIVIVNRLEGNAYVEDGRYTAGETAPSRLLPGFTIDVGELFAVIEGVED